MSESDCRVDALQLLIRYRHCAEADAFDRWEVCFGGATVAIVKHKRHINLISSPCGASSCSPNTAQRSTFTAAVSAVPCAVPDVLHCVFVSGQQTWLAGALRQIPKHCSTSVRQGMFRPLDSLRGIYKTTLCTQVRASKLALPPDYLGRVIQ